jgi:WD40 repeat protein
MAEPQENEGPLEPAANDSSGGGNVNIGGSVGGSVILGDGNVVNNTGFTAEETSKLVDYISTTFEPKPFTGLCPYKGLDVFNESDADLFFGREKLVDKLVNRVKNSRTVFITGPSGSGKSSLVRAGLIHQLRCGGIQEQHSERWLYVIMKPGRDPIEEMAKAFSRLTEKPETGEYVRQNALNINMLHQRADSLLTDDEKQRLVLFIDQFEEVFTQLSKDKAEAFITLLMHTLTIVGGRVSLLFAMRSDFIPNCVSYPKLNEVLSEQFIQVGPMEREELQNAIVQPALQVGLRIDPELSEQIITDMKEEPGALPLMQFALKDLIDAQQAAGSVNALTKKDYMERGGIHKALERHADNSFKQLDNHEQELARVIFSSLIEVGRGTQDSRRTAFFNELVPAYTKSSEVEAVIHKLADTRLITTGENDENEEVIADQATVTISHETLIDAWPWLKTLVNENRDLITLKNEIMNDANEWEEHNYDPSYLYSGGRLANVNEQLKENRLDFNETAYKFIQAGQTRQKRSRLALISAIIGIIASLMAAVILFGNQSIENARQANENATQSAQNGALAATNAAIANTAQANAEEAQKQTRLARTGELSAKSVVMRDQDFQLSLLLGIAAFQTFVTVQSQGILLDNVQANPQIQSFSNGHPSHEFLVAFSPDGKTLASGGGAYPINLWDVESRQPIGQLLNEIYPTSVAFSPDGKTLASGSGDGTIILWDIEKRQPIGQPLPGERGQISSMAFSPDGKILAAGSGDDAIFLWDVETHQPIDQPLTGHTDMVYGVYSVAFSPDGKTLASGSFGGPIILWDVETHQPIGQPLIGHKGYVFSVAFSPDGKILASGSEDGAIILWDAETHQPIGQPLAGHNGAVPSVAFSPDGKILASGSEDGTIILWDVETHQPIGQPLTGHTSYVATVAFSPDGKTLASGSWDGPIILWDVESRQPIGQPLIGHKGYVFSVAFSPDGKILASGSEDGAIILWDVETHQPIGQPLTGHNGAVPSVAFSPDGKILASGSEDGAIILWDVETHQPIGQPLTGHTSYVLSVAFSPDAKLLASGSWDGTIILWDVESRQPIGQPLTGHTSYVNSVAFSPDGKILASGSDDGTIMLWDMETHQPIGQPLTGPYNVVYSVAFSPDGKILASGNLEHNIILLDVESHRPLGQPLTGHTRAVRSVAFSPDGKLLASGSEDDTIILWDVETHQPIGQPLTGHTDSIYSVAFSPDGKSLASGSNDKSVILWHVDPQSLIEISCRKANRNLTRAEWAQYLGDARPYPAKQEDALCSNLPIEPEGTPTPTVSP